MTNTKSNPLGIAGIAAVEFAAPTREDRERLGKLFNALGSSKTSRHVSLDIDLYEQNQIRFLVNREPKGFAAEFAREHGPSIPSLAWWVEDAKRAYYLATARGARGYEGPGIYGDAPAIYGVGGSLIYFVEATSSGLGSEFIGLELPERVKPRGFLAIDHLTNNVQKGTLEHWAHFYKRVFGFTEVRTFDIRGKKTGLFSYALRSPCGSFCIPINEGNENKSQIEEYLREYKGAGVQHLALLSNDLLQSLDGLAAGGVETLDIDDDYYESVFDRVPGVKEDRATIERLKVLVDGDPDGYLLQIFTKNVIGPIFFEMIQRENHLSFGEGNFGALFRSIERDQERRGVI